MGLMMLKKCPWKDALNDDGMSDTAPAPFAGEDAVNNLENAKGGGVCSAPLILAARVSRCFLYSIEMKFRSASARMACIFPGPKIAS